MDRDAVIDGTLHLRGGEELATANRINLSPNGQRIRPGDFAAHAARVTVFCCSVTRLFSSPAPGITRPRTADALIKQRIPILPPERADLALHHCLAVRVADSSSATSIALSIQEPSCDRHSPPYSARERRSGPGSCPAGFAVGWNQITRFAVVVEQRINQVERLLYASRIEELDQVLKR